jgi:hypothetical protein
LKARPASVPMTSAGLRICEETPARVRSGAAGNQAAGEGQAKVNNGPPGAGARAYQVAGDRVRGLRVLTDPGGGCLPGHAGRQAGRQESPLPPACISAASFMLRIISKGAER